LDSFRWVAEIHRQGPGQDNERLLLDRVPVALALRARRIAPHAPARMREACDIAESRDVAGNAARVGLAFDPLELVGTDHAEAHVGTLPMSFAATAGLSS